MTKPKDDSAKPAKQPRAKKQAKPIPDSDECPLQGTEELHTGSMDAMGRLLGGLEPFPTETTGNKANNGGTKQDAAAGTTTQATTAATKTDAGDVPLIVDETGSLYAAASLTREESRAQASNRWVLEGRRWEADTFRKDKIRQFRAAGLTKEAAGERAWEACLAQFPPPGTEPEAIEPPEPIAEPIPESPAAILPPEPEQGVPGLGDLPADWGKLPANASLQVEISWVSANRLVVRSGSGVDLSRALSPAPSYSALSWLETSILFPSKFADISVKATAQQDDEREGIRREKLAIEEIRSLLAEMLVE